MSWTCPSCGLENDTSITKCACGAEDDTSDVSQQYPSNTPSPVNQALAARKAGAHIFQIALPLSTTTGFTVAMVGAFTKTTNAEHASVLDAIEAQGWRLEHAGYVYRVTGAVSRDKFFASGQQDAVSGEIVGIYVSRASPTTTP